MGPILIRVKSLPNLYRCEETGVFYLRRRHGKKLWIRNLKTRTMSTVRENYERHITELENEIKTQQNFRVARPVKTNLKKRCRIKYSDGLELSFGMRLGAGQKIRSRKNLVNFLSRLREETLDLWANKTVAEITYYDVKDFFKERRKKSLGGSRPLLTQLRKVFDDMIDHDRRNGVLKIVDNPCRGVKAPAAAKKTPLLVTREDVTKTLTEIKMQNRYLYDYFYLCLLTGAKPEEVTRLACDDLDINSEVIKITENDVRYATTTYRKIPMSTQCLNHCIHLLRSQKNGEHGLVFDALPSLTRLNYILRMTSQNIGCRRVSLQHLQMAYVQSAIDHGLNPPQIAKLIGHRDGGALVCKNYQNEYLACSCNYTTMTIQQ